MIDIGFVESLIRMLDESSLDSLEIRRGGTRIRLAKSPDGHAAVGAQSTNNTGAAPVPDSEPPPAEPAAAPSAESSSAGLVEVTSPMVGTFYRAPSPEAAPYVEAGGTVAAGDVLCVIEAMKTMNHIESEYSGEVAAVLVENSEPVEYGQPLFIIRT